MLRRRNGHGAALGLLREGFDDCGANLRQVPHLILSRLLRLPIGTVQGQRHPADGEEHARQRDERELPRDGHGAQRRPGSRAARNSIGCRCHIQPSFGANVETPSGREQRAAAQALDTN